jgi:hypothetical protein
MSYIVTSVVRYGGVVPAMLAKWRQGRHNLCASVVYLRGITGQDHTRKLCCFTGFHRVHCGSRLSSQCDLDEALYRFVFATAQL